MSICICVFVLGGLSEDVTEKDVHSTFIPFGDIVDINLPLDYETEKHRGFAFVGKWYSELLCGSQPGATWFLNREIINF